MKSSANARTNLDETTVSDLAVINSYIHHLNDEEISTLGNLFSLNKNKPNHLKDYIKNFQIPKLYSHDDQIKNDLLDVIKNIDIIEKQIVPMKMINMKYLNSSFHYIHVKENEEMEVIIPVSSENKNKTTFLQIIPNGLFYCSNFVIQENGVTINYNNAYRRSYLQLSNKGKKIKLLFKSCPQKLLFFQILFYKKMKKDDVNQMIRNQLHISNNISNYKAEICHNDHSIKLSNFIDSIQKTNDFICPICNEKVDFMYTNNVIESYEEVIDYILNDNDEQLIKFISTLEDEHIYFCKHKLPKILQDGPTFIELCCFYNSKKCFQSLLDYYIEFDENMINQKDCCNRSPIHFACFNGDLSIIQILIGHGEHLDSKDKNGLRPIHYAVMGNQIKLIQYMNETMMNMFSCDNDKSKSPLHLACQYGCLDIVKYYCEVIIPTSEIEDFGGFLECYCSNKKTPFHVACKYDQIAIINYFLSNKLAQIQTKFNDNLNPLIYSCEYGSFSCVVSLLKVENIFDFDHNQIKKAFNAALSSGSLDIISYMIKKHPIDITPFMILEAISSDHFDIADFLIKNKNSKCQSSNNLMNWLKEIVKHKYSETLKNNRNVIENNSITTDINSFSAAEVQSESDGSDRSDESDDIIQFGSEANSTVENAIEINNDADFELKIENSLTFDFCKPEESEKILLNDDQTDQISHNRNSSALPMPLISTNFSNQFIPQKYKPCPFLHDNSKEIVTDSGNNQLQIPPNLDPSSIGYAKNHGNGPTTFSELSKCSFNTKDQVKIAVQNISIIEMKSVHIVKSERQRIVYKCVSSCCFSMTWNIKNGVWVVYENNFKDHSCTNETSKIPKYHSCVIDSAIKSMSLQFTSKDTGMTLLKHFFGQTANRTTLTRRLNAIKYDKITDLQWWQMIPNYLENNIQNGGLSDMIITEDNEIYSFAMLPQYARLLLSSNAILPVIILDGTFQCSIYRGTLIIVMIVSSNRTNIPIGWSWGPSENEESIKLILDLIKNVNPDIETIISDEGTALKAAISEIFPKAIHKFCAWHVSKKITDKQTKKIFWELLRADHQVIFQALLVELFKHDGDAPNLLANGRVGMFARFFEGVKDNDIITSSPCESINSEIRKYKTEIPIKIFHYLELIGYNRCIELLNISTKMTPYYLKRKKHIEEKAKRMEVDPNSRIGTSRIIYDSSCTNHLISWEVNTNVYHCDCGKYTDRGFPCAHMAKAFKDLNLPYERCVHECYYTSTIREALKDLNVPVKLCNLQTDETLHAPKEHVKFCRTNRYLFSFERYPNKI